MTSSIAKLLVLSNIISKEQLQGTIGQLRKDNGWLENLLMQLGDITEAVTKLVPFDLVKIFIAFLITTVLSLIIIRCFNLHGCFTADHVYGGPQKFHSKPTPRVGGIAILAGILLTTVCIYWKGEAYKNEYIFLLLAALPAFLGGILEDLTKKVGVTPRLFACMVAAMIGFWLLDASLICLDLPFVDSFLVYLPVSFLFTSFTVSGVANAINIIDGYNGLASMVSLLIFGALGYVSYKVGDPFLMTVCLTIGGTILGFFIWNYPHGLIFLGDGGAYLLGFLIGEISILLVHRHLEVSPWFPLLLTIYPVYETIFSIYRRKFLRGKHPGYPDALHLHSLVYRRVVHWAIDSSKAKDKLQCNSMTSPFLWILTMLSVIPAVIFWQNTIMLMAFVAAFIFFYSWIYWSIIRFKTPSWLINLYTPQYLLRGNNVLGVQRTQHPLGQVNDRL